AEKLEQRLAEDRRARQHHEDRHRHGGCEPFARGGVARGGNAEKDRDREEGIEHCGQRRDEAQVFRIGGHQSIILTPCRRTTRATSPSLPPIPRTAATSSSRGCSRRSVPARRTTTRCCSSSSTRPPSFG